MGRAVHKIMRLFVFLFLGVSQSWGLRLHSYFTPGMMMQRDVPTKVWGFDLVGDLVTAELACQEAGHDEIVTHRLRVVRASAEVWEAELPPQPAAAICEFRASSETEEIVLTDIMFGDIWLCSGQSNMEQNMYNIMNSSEEIAASASFTSIRFTVVKNAVSTEEDLDADVPLQQPWADPTDASRLGGMSAVCFLYARTLHQLWQAAGQEPVPLGLVDSDWGGTLIEAWSPPQSLASCDAPLPCNEDAPQNCHNRLYNAMIHPLARVALKGFLWYQGEANTGFNRDIYNCTFPAMIDAWREVFSSNSNTAPDAPFGVVQLASWRPDNMDAGFPVIRWHLTADYGYVPNDRLQNVFMASPLDTYDDKDGYPGGIHPRYKQIVGERLAIAGMDVAYGTPLIPLPYGPIPSSVKVTANSANQVIIVTYDDVIVYDNTEISGFYICQDTPINCDSTNRLDGWVEVAKEAVSQLNEYVLYITPDTPFNADNVFSLAYAWRETPVKRYLGLPVYGDKEHYSLPSPPWKMACGGGDEFCVM